MNIRIHFLAHTIVTISLIIMKVLGLVKFTGIKNPNEITTRNTFNSINNWN